MPDYIRVVHSYVCKFQTKCSTLMCLSCRPVALLLCVQIKSQVSHSYVSLFTFLFLSYLLVAMTALVATIIPISNLNFHHQVRILQQLVVQHLLNRLVLAKSKDTIFLVVVSVISLKCQIIKKN